MNIAIVQFPGSNCERETILAVQRAGMTAVEFLWNESPDKLAAMDGYVIVGGFSYEDRSRAGIIAALDPLMQIIGQQSALGKPVLGICNGAQILLETGLIPGLKDNQTAMALTENKRIVNGKVLGTGFYNAWIYMRSGTTTTPNAFTRCLNKDSVLHVPIAHAEGRFLIAPDLWQVLEENGVNAFYYCDANGDITDNFPVNPNGSEHNIAALMNKSGNVMAMMPHPERTEDGDAIFHSMREYILEHKEFSPESIPYTLISEKIEVWKKPHTGYELLVPLIITDNHALTVQNTLHQSGIPLKVRRMSYWHIDSDAVDLIENIKQTGVLYNDRKEYVLNSLPRSQQGQRAYLVKAKDDLTGLQKQQMLQDHFSLQDLPALHHGIVWVFEGEEDTISELMTQVMQTHIIFNPHSHDCYEYNYS